MRLLVTAISGNVSTGILRSLEKCGYSLYGCDVSDYPSGMDLVIDWSRVPYAVEEGYVSELLSVCERWGIQAVLPANETELMVLDKYREVFSERNICLVMNSSAILHTCLDKYDCMRALATLGIRIPKTVRPQEESEGAGSYIVKPRFGCGSKFLKKISSIKEAQELEDQFGQPLVVQENLPDESEEYTMSVFSNGDVVRCIIFRRRLTHGYTNFVELVQDDSMAAAGETIAKAWRLKGSINIQMRRKNGEAYVFEINPRLSGTSHFRSLLGFNDAFWWVETAIGHSLPAYTPQYTQAIGVRELTSKIIYRQ